MTDVRRWRGCWEGRACASVTWVTGQGAAPAQAGSPTRMPSSSIVKMRQRCLGQGKAGCEQQVVITYI